MKIEPGRTRFQLQIAAVLRMNHLDDRFRYVDRLSKPMLIQYFHQRFHYSGVQPFLRFIGRSSGNNTLEQTRLGHEVAGIVDKVAEGVIGVREGDHVALRYVWGAFSEYVCCSPFSVKVLPQSLPLLEGSLI